MGGHGCAPCLPCRMGRMGRARGEVAAAVGGSASETAAAVGDAGAAFVHAPAGADSAVARAHTIAVAVAAVAGTLLAESPDSSPYAHAGRTAVSSLTGPTRPHTTSPSPSLTPPQHATSGSRSGSLHGSGGRGAGSPRCSMRRTRRTPCSPAPRTHRGTRARARASAGTGSCIRALARHDVVPAAAGVDFADVADSVDADAVVDRGAATATATAGAPARMPISAPTTQAARVRAHVGAGASVRSGAPREARTVPVLVPGVRSRAAHARKSLSSGRGPPPCACSCPSLRSTATRAAAGAPPSALTRRGPHYGRPRSQCVRAGRGVSPHARRRAAIGIRRREGGRTKRQG